MEMTELHLTGNPLRPTLAQLHEIRVAIERTPVVSVIWKTPLQSSITFAHTDVACYYKSWLKTARLYGTRIPTIKLRTRHVYPDGASQMRYDVGVTIVFDHQSASSPIMATLEGMQPRILKEAPPKRRILR